jgi:hypothetical protein
VDGVVWVVRPEEFSMAAVTRWAVATGAACLLIAAVYLPPRGGVHPPGAIITAQLPQASAARLHAQALADEWRAVDGDVRLLDARARLQQAFAARDPSIEGPVLLLHGEPGLSARAKQRLNAALDSLWHALGLHETKVRVGMVIETSASSRATPFQPRPEQTQFSYLEPDSTDRATCTVLVDAGSYWSSFLADTGASTRGPTSLVPWLKAGLGPCGFYARYGAPSRSVGRWLRARSWDLASVLSPPPAPSASERDAGVEGNADRPWYWERVYMFGPETIACLAAREAGCLTAVLAGADAGDRDGLRAIRETRHWWRVQRLVPGERYLSDVASDIGADRFQRFWTSPLPVDTALAAALKQPIGVWTAHWQARFISPIRLGPSAPAGAGAMALLLAVGAVVVAVLAVSRRQVR